MNKRRPQNKRGAALPFIFPDNTFSRPAVFSFPRSHLVAGADATLKASQYLPGPQILRKARRRVRQSSATCHRRSSTNRSSPLGAKFTARPPFPNTRLSVQHCSTYRIFLFYGTGSNAGFSGRSAPTKRRPANVLYGQAPGSCVSRSSPRRNTRSLTKWISRDGESRRERQERRPVRQPKAARSFVFGRRLVRAVFVRDACAERLSCF